MTNETCLVIGYGSIGERHTRILNELGCRVGVVSKRNIDYPIVYTSIKEAIDNEKPTYIVVANGTSDHEATLLQINSTQFDGKVLVEKPLYPVMRSVSRENSTTYVGYNLRFHPLIQTLKSKLKNAEIVSVQCYVGQYLPTWRPGTDYTSSYSASAEKGGGVLRDLSHELDYLQFLFGEWQEMTASGGKFTNLAIDSDDHFSLLYRTDRVPLVTLQMNYVDHLTQRMLIINTNNETYKVDFIKNTLQLDDEITTFTVERDDTYRSQHDAILTNEVGSLCTYIEGLSVVKMIEMAEKASNKKVWVSNE